MAEAIEREPIAYGSLPRRQETARELGTTIAALLVCGGFDVACVVAARATTRAPTSCAAVVDVDAVAWQK